MAYISTRKTVVCLPRVTMATREESTRGPGTPPVVKGLIWFTDGSRTKKGLWLESMDTLWEEGSVFL